MVAIRFPMFAFTHLKPVSFDSRKGFFDTLALCSGRWSEACGGEFDPRALWGSVKTSMVKLSFFLSWTEDRIRFPSRYRRYTPEDLLIPGLFGMKVDVNKTGWSPKQDVGEKWEKVLGCLGMNHLNDVQTCTVYTLCIHTWCVSTSDIKRWYSLRYRCTPKNLM